MGGHLRRWVLPLSVIAVFCVILLFDGAIPSFRQSRDISIKPKRAYSYDPPDTAFVVGNLPSKDGASTLTQLEDVAGFGMIKNLYYYNGTYVMFFDGTTRERSTLARTIESTLCKNDPPNFSLRVHDYASRPQNVDLVWPGITWVLLTSPTFIDHYFHFLEYLIGMWPVAYFMKSTDPVHNVIIGPFVDDKWMVKESQNGINDIILRALWPDAKQWFGRGKHALPSDMWIRMDTAITGERYATSANPH
jgi:hypothetical protein